MTKNLIKKNLLPGKEALVFRRPEKRRSLVIGLPAMTDTEVKQLAEEEKRQASLAQKEEYKRRQLILKDAGYDVKVDGSWGPYQQALWDRGITQIKLYPLTPFGLINYGMDYLTDNEYEHIPFEERLAKLTQGHEPTVEDKINLFVRDQHNPLNLGLLALVVAGGGNVLSNLVGRAATGLSALASLYPTVTKAAELGFGIDAAHRYFATDKGWEKTDRLLQEGNYGKAAKSAMGDIFDIGMFGIPVFKIGKEGYDLTRQGFNWVNGNYVLPYRLSRAINQGVTENGIIAGYNRNPRNLDTGSIWDYQSYLDEAFPNSKVQDIQYHMGPKGIQKLKPNINNGESYNSGTWNINPEAKGIYVSPDLELPKAIRKFTTERLENTPFFEFVRRNFFFDWDVPNSKYTDIYPVKINTINPLYTRGSWTWGMSQKKYNNIMSLYDAIVNDGTFPWLRVKRMRETILPSSDQTLILGSNEDAIGFNNWMRKFGAKSARTTQELPADLLLEDIVKFDTKEVPYMEVPLENSGFVSDKDILSVYEARIKNKGIDASKYNNAKVIYYDTPEGQKILNQHVRNYVFTPNNPKYNTAIKNFILRYHKGDEESAIKDYLSRMYTDPEYVVGLNAVVMPSRSKAFATDRNLLKNYNLVLAHELGHASHFPEASIGEELNKALGNNAYWVENNNTEIGIRLEQLLNKAGITSGKHVTGTRWKNLFESYLNSNQYDNNMRELYLAINSVENGWKIIEKWASNKKNVWGLIPASGVMLTNSSFSEN